MIACPICDSRIHTGDESRMTGDCQCSRETMAREIARLHDAIGILADDMQCMNDDGAIELAKWPAAQKIMSIAAGIAAEAAP
jgi:hypothetical protein